MAAAQTQADRALLSRLLGATLYNTEERPLVPVVAVDGRKNGPETSSGPAMSRTEPSPPARALQAQLAALAQALDDAAPAAAPPPGAARDRGLRDSPEHRLTRTDLAQIVLSLQEIQNTQMDRLQALVDGLAGNDRRGDKENAPPPAQYSHRHAPSLAAEKTARTPYHVHFGEADGDMEDPEADGVTQSECEVDDSALYCPTVVASDHTAQRRQQQHRRLYLHQSDAADSRRPAPRTPLDRHLSHIEVDLAASPAATVLTMDGSYCTNHQHHNGTFLANAVDEDEAASVHSEETPVLDRYRLDNDDNSPHGFVVVPNERGAHRQQPRGRPNTTTAPTPQGPTVAAPAFGGRPRVFRKTPYRTLRDAAAAATPVIPEHRPLWLEPCMNGQDLLDQYDLEEESLLSSPRASPTKSAGPHRSEASSLAAATRDSPSSSPLLMYANASIQVDQSNETKTEGSVPSELPPSAYASPALGGGNNIRTSLTRRFSNMPRSNYDAARLRPVTSEDFHASPRIVQMQVTLADANAAVRALNRALDRGALPTTFSDRQAGALLEPLGLSRRQCKNVLMSLCHWRRLRMRRPSQVGAGPGAAGSGRDLGLMFEVARTEEVFEGSP